jgi:ribosome-interacting GTPase 1
LATAIFNGKGDGYAETLTLTLNSTQLKCVCQVTSCKLGLNLDLLLEELWNALDVVRLSVHIRYKHLLP